MIWHNPSQVNHISSRMLRIKTLDMHTGGEPVRIILDGFPKLSGNILHIRKQLQENYDYLRKAIMWEPRGHYDMYGLLPVAAERANSDFGVIFMHNEGYSTMCGHATLAIAKCAVDLHWVQPRKDVSVVKIDAPCGQLIAYAERELALVTKVSFENVPSWVVEQNATLKLEDQKEIHYDLAFGGAFYAFVDTCQLGLKVIPSNASVFKTLAREIKGKINNAYKKIEHPFYPDLSFLYGVIFYEDFPNHEPYYSKNVCVFAEGELDRSPTGSGISARAALLYRQGKLKTGRKIEIQSIIGSTMGVEIIATKTYGPYDAVIPKVSGRAYYSGIHEFWIDPTDPFKEGFLIK